LDAPVPVQHRLDRKTKDGLVLLGFDRDTDRDGYLHLTLYWTLQEPLDREVELVFDVHDDSGRRVKRSLTPSCYHIYPVRAWEPGQVVREEHYLPMEDVALEGAYSLLRLGVSDYQTGRFLVGEDGKDFRGVNIASFDGSGERP
jgi:hypothetical protein